MSHQYADAAPESTASVAGPVAVKDHIVCLGAVLGDRGSRDTMAAHRLGEVKRLCRRWNRQLSSRHLCLGQWVGHMQVIARRSLFRVFRKLSDLMGA